MRTTRNDPQFLSRIFFFQFVTKMYKKLRYFGADNTMEFRRVNVIWAGTNDIDHFDFNGIMTHQNILL